MPATVRRPKQDRGLETQQRILDAALCLFAERGYDATSVRDIAARLNLNHGLITYHHGSKELLWREAVQWLFERLAQEMTSPPGDELLPLRPRFESFVHRYVRYCARHPEHARLMIQESMHANARIDWAARAFIAPSHARLFPFFADLVSAGIIADVPLVSFLYVLNAACQAPFVLSYEIDQTHSADTTSDAAIDGHAAMIVKLFTRSPRQDDNG